jgi:hypothetical protein
VLRAWVRRCLEHSCLALRCRLPPFSASKVPRWALLCHAARRNTGGLLSDARFACEGNCGLLISCVLCVSTTIACVRLRGVVTQLDAEWDAR